MSVPIDSYGRAAAAYTRAASGGVTAETAVESERSFAEMVKDVVDDAITSGVNSEKASVGAVGQGTDLNHVVTAVAEAEATLQTVLAVRERIIEAYKDILRMPI